MPMMLNISPTLATRSHSLPVREVRVRGQSRPDGFHPFLLSVWKWKGKFKHPYGKGRIPSYPSEQPCHLQERQCSLAWEAQLGGHTAWLESYLYDL